jgi:hypothetical protein
MAEEEEREKKNHKNSTTVLQYLVIAANRFYLSESWQPKKLGV